MKSARCLVLSTLVLSVAFGCNKKEPEPTASAPEQPATPAAVESAPPPAATPPAAASAAPEAAAAPSAAAAPAGIPAPDDVAAPPKDAKKTASGLTSKVLKAGTSKEHPGDVDRVKVHYTGWTKDGKMFDSSVQRGEPATFGVTQVIPGWTEALKLMSVGEKRRQRRHLALVG